MESFLALAVAALIAVVIVQQVKLRRPEEFTRERRRAQSTNSTTETVVVSPAKRALDAEVTERHRDLPSKFLLGAVVVEIDHLRLVRDAFSDAIGHELLGAVATLVQSQLRDTDHLDLLSDREIVVVTNELPTETDLQRLADRIVNALSAPIEFGSRSQLVTCSIGIAHITNKDDATELIGNAQAAKNVASASSGFSRELFDQTVKAEAMQSLELEHQLAQAIENDEISVHYQPAVATESKQVDRFECLIRWFHEHRGPIRPDEFLEVASRSDLIVKLGRFVLGEACYQAAAWTYEFQKPITVSVNVNHNQLLGEDFVATVSETLNRTGLPAPQLELEFSEKLVLDDIDYSQQMFAHLANTGVRIAIDNFGATAASIGVLRKLSAINTLKLDRRFIENVHTSEIERNLVASIASFASQLGIDVVAEGVETEQHAEVLAEMGIPYLQGFLLQRPAPAEDVVGLLDGSIAAS